MLLSLILLLQPDTPIQTEFKFVHTRKIIATRCVSLCCVAATCCIVCAILQTRHDFLVKKINHCKATSCVTVHFSPQDNISEGEVHVDPKWHKHFVAKRGEVLNEIAKEYGGVVVSFPRNGVNSDRVVLKGAKDCVEAAKARILEIVQDLESMVTIEVVIPQEYHRAIMGAKGSNVQEVTTR